MYHSLTNPPHASTHFCFGLCAHAQANSSRSLVLINQGLQAAERVFAVINDVTVDNTLSPDGNSSVQKIRSIQFRALSFTYASTGKRVLNDLSFTLKNGTPVALVGGSGAGKTSIFSLLLRFYHPDSPDMILIDNIRSLESVSLSEWRNIIVRYIRHFRNAAHIPQVVFFFKPKLITRSDILGAGICPTRSELVHRDHI